MVTLVPSKDLTWLKAAVNESSIAIVDLSTRDAATRAAHAAGAAESGAANTAQSVGGAAAAV